MDEPDSDLDITLRSPRAVGERIILLASVCARGILEQTLDTATAIDPDHDLEDAASARFDLINWLQHEGLDRALTASEREILKAPIGTLADDNGDDPTWGAESLLALVWSVGLVEELQWQSAGDAVDPILEQLPSPWESTRSFLAGLSLRPEDHIAITREQAELWHWRATVEVVYRDSGEDERQELREAMAAVVQEAIGARLLPPGPPADFAVAGTAVASLSDRAIDELIVVAGERLRALNWVCGFGDRWDAVPLHV